MRRIWDRLRMNRFVVLGRAGMDLYADPPGTRAEEATAFQAELGGSAANIAVALATLGAGATLLTRLSDDAVGRFCARALRRYGVGLAVTAPAGDGTRTSLAVTETRIDDCQTVIYRNGAADFALSVADVAAVDFTATGALVVTGTALAAEPSRGATLAAIGAARAAGAVTVLDLDYRPYSWAGPEEARATCRAAADASDILVGNDDEFALLAGPGADLDAYARDFAQRGGRIAVLKRGRLGSRVFTPDYSVTIGVFPVAALKPMGAGDAFLGATLAGLAVGMTLDAALRRGSAAAAMVVSAIGCAPASPTADALDAFMTGTAETDAYSAL